MSVQDARREVAGMRASFSQAITDSVDVLHRALDVLELGSNGTVDAETVAKLTTLLLDAIEALRTQALTWRAVEATMAVVEQ